MVVVEFLTDRSASGFHLDLELDQVDLPYRWAQAVNQVKNHVIVLRCLCLLAAFLPAASARAQTPSGIDPVRTVEAARRQVGVTVGYDPEYRRLAYPGGDVAENTGVCTDVVTRALRTQGFDLQKAVHEDMVHHFSGYPHQWGLKAPDSNIDHRRVPNLVTFFQRQGWKQTVTANTADYHPGDIVTWDLGGGHLHIGVVSDAKNAADCPLVIHNIGQGTREDDNLFGFKIIGHYRLSKGN